MIGVELEQAIIGMDLHNKICAACGEPIDATDKVLQCDDEFFHEDCFVCAQCFQPFPEDGFYTFEGQRYCLHDFQLLYAPICKRCQSFVEGEVVKALNYHWCMECFTCEDEDCPDKDIPLQDRPFVPVRYRGTTGETLKVVCRICYERFRARQAGKDVCQFCWRCIEKEERHLKIRYKGDPYHCYHFNCDSCGNELTGESQEYLGKLLCRRCHDKSEIPICGACRRPIEGRVVRAMDKSWHVEHFVCHHCEKPFLNDTYFVGADDGKPYCEYHYNKLFGDSCSWCGRVIQSQVIAAFEKRWCAECFQCYTCNKSISPREKFIEYDMKPICKKCFDHFPYELKKRLKKGADCYAKDRKVQIKNEKKAH